jgi:hypothetical protein
MMTFGGDFNYQNALLHFKNVDKLIKYVNAEVRIFIASLFSTNNVLFITRNLAS